MTLSKDAAKGSLLDFAPLMRSLELLVSLVGVEKTAHILEDNYKKRSLVNNTDAVYLRQLVGSVLGCTEQEMLYGRSRNPTRYFSVGFCCYYLHIYLKYDIEEVLHMMNKNQSVCYKSMKAVGRLNERYFADQKYIEIKDRLDKTVNEYKLTKK